MPCCILYVVERPWLKKSSLLVEQAMLPELHVLLVHPNDLLVPMLHYGEVIIRKLPLYQENGEERETQAIMRTLLWQVMMDHFIV